MKSPRKWLPFASLGVIVALAVPPGAVVSADKPADPASYDWMLPDESKKQSFEKTVPIVFVTRNANPAEWEKLPTFWNQTTQEVVDPISGKKVTQGVVKIKVPLGLTNPPPVPVENPMTLAKWELGRDLYFDKILSSDRTVSCASCHDPKYGFSDGSKTSTGIGGQKGGANAPTVINSAYHRLQFWDGRAASLEDQAQGPVQNPIEMFDGVGNAWHKAIERIRSKPEYVARFEAVFGHAPTRDAVAKAIATYERTVLSGNSIYDRAELLMRQRVEEEESGKFELKPIDFEKALKAAVAAKDINALSALHLTLDAPAQKLAETAKRVHNGRNLFFGKARCTACHIGDNFTDNEFHNLGVGVVNGQLPAGHIGRFGSQPTGHKNPALVGAHKTPGLRALLSTAPYMHDGSEKTLEDVVELYDRGGNAHEFLDPKMRDLDAEAAWLKAKAEGKPYDGPPVQVFNDKPIVPFKLNLSKTEKEDLVLFMRALQGDPIDPKVTGKVK